MGRAGGPPEPTARAAQRRGLYEFCPRPLHQIIVHHFTARLVEACPPALYPVQDIEWRQVLGTRITDALRPDITVTRRSELRRTAGVYDAPVLVVEVRSPSTRKPQLEQKKATYLRDGLGWYVDLEVDDAEEQATVRWYRADGDAWALVAEATGAQALVVDEPFPLTVVPNDLLEF